MFPMSLEWIEEDGSVGYLYVWFWVEGFVAEGMEGRGGRKGEYINRGLKMRDLNVVRIFNKIGRWGRK
jgi:hypothetical protein